MHVVDGTAVRPPDRRPRPAVRGSYATEDQHPSAAHAELAPMLDQRREDEHAEDDEGEPDDALHDRIDARRKIRAQEDGRRTDHEHHERVSEGVEGAEDDRRATVLLRARDVRDRRDVIPIDPVAEPEQERRQEDAETEGLPSLGQDVHTLIQSGPAIYGNCKILR